MQKGRREVRKHSQRREEEEECNGQEMQMEGRADAPRTQTHAKTEMTAEAASSRSSQGHTGACQDRKAPAALSSSNRRAKRSR